MTRKIEIEFIEQQNTKLILPACSIETFKAFKQMFSIHQPFLIEENGMIKQFAFDKIIYNEEEKLLIIDFLQISNSKPSKF